MLKSFIYISLLLSLLTNTTLTDKTQKNVDQKPTNQSKTQIVLLGTGTPNADPDHSGPAVAIIVNDTPYLFDCGPGVVRRAAAAHKNGVSGLAVAKLRRLFISHLHSDHTVGYPDVIFTPAVLERDAPLEVYGPPGIKAMTDNIMAAYKEDIDIRLNGLEPAKPRGYEVKVTEIKPGIIYDDGQVKVKSIPVKHGSWKHSFGFRIETPDKIIVISGDCIPDNNIIENCNGCDVLIHEVYSQTGFSRRPPEWQKYHASFHTSSTELAEIAKKTKPRLLILYHQLLWGVTPEQLLDEIRKDYKGIVVFGKDLDVY